MPSRHTAIICELTAPPPRPELARLAADPAVDDSHLLVEQHEIGAVARGDGPKLPLETEKSGRVRAGQHRRLLEAQAKQFDAVADRGRHVEVRTGDRPARAHALAVAG